MNPSLTERQQNTTSPTATRSLPDLYSCHGVLMQAKAITQVCEKSLGCLPKLSSTTALNCSYIVIENAKYSWANMTVN